MSLVSELLEALPAWRNHRSTRPDRARPPRLARPVAERLDHRQLLAVNFTGNVITDFPTSDPDVVVARPAADDPRYKIPDIPPTIEDLVLVSGFQLDAIRLSYDPQLDILQIGIEQPNNRKSNQPVIAGDVDNNLVDGTVDPATQARVDAPSEFIDFAALGGTETMLVYLNLNPDVDAVPDLVAGIDGPGAARKSYQVARFNVNADPDSPAGISPFGEFLPQNTGASRLGDSPAAPNFEFTVNRFAELYRSVTGRAFTAPARIEVGAFAAGSNDDGISEAFIPGIAVNIPITPTPPVDCPPVSPPILINPHAQQHINTFHNTRIRVNIFGTFGFRVSEIDPTTVRLGGAAPVFDRILRTNADQYPDRLFIFNGLDVDLPRGPQNARVTGRLVDGTPFIAAAQVFNQPTFFTEQEIARETIPVRYRPAPGPDDDQARARGATLEAANIARALAKAEQQAKRTLAVQAAQERRAERAAAMATATTHQADHDPRLLAQLIRASGQAR